MDIRQKIQQEAEKRYGRVYYTSHENDQFIEGAEWLDSEIVQPLIKENEGLKEGVIEYSRKAKKLEGAINRFMATIPLDNGNWYLSDFTEALDELKKTISDGK